MIHRYQSGSPISVTATNFDSQALFNPNLRADVLLGPDQQKLTDSITDPNRATGTPYLNPAAFKNPPLTDKRVPIHLGNAPRLSAEREDLRSVWGRFLVDQENRLAVP